jgi:serine protease Do
VLACGAKGCAFEPRRGHVFLPKKILLSLIFVILFAVVIIAGYFFNEKINNLVERNEALSREFAQLTRLYAELKGKPEQASQDELLIQAVGKTAPSVVSIVVTKDVPELEVVYINPFGDDPFFGDFGIRIPQYRQKGITEKKVGAGTGFIVNSSGYIVTNRHVVEDASARYTVLLSDGRQKQAQILYRDNEIDVAVLKIDGGGYSTIPFGNSDVLKLGQSVFAIGNALGEYSNSVSVGIVSGLNRDIEAFGGNQTEKLQSVIQTDAAINPGNSGGPLVNFSGEVVGINVAVERGAENIGFAIPINAVKSTINIYIR